MAVRLGYDQALLARVAEPSRAVMQDSWRLETNPCVRVDPARLRARLSTRLRVPFTFYAAWGSLTR